MCRVLWNVWGTVDREICGRSRCHPNGLGAWNVIAPRPSTTPSVPREEPPAAPPGSSSCRQHDRGSPAGGRQEENGIAPPHSSRACVWGCPCPARGGGRKRKEVALHSGGAVALRPAGAQAAGRVPRLSPAGVALLRATQAGSPEAVARPAVPVATWAGVIWVPPPSPTRLAKTANGLLNVRITTRPWRGVLP